MSAWSIGATVDLSHCWLCLSAFKLHNDFNSWLGILRVDNSFRRWRRQPDGPPNGLHLRLWVLGNCSWAIWIFHMESLLAVVVFPFLWWKVKRAVRPFSPHMFDSWYFKLLEFTHYTLGDYSSKMAPNGSHLLVFMSLCSLLPQWIRDEGWCELPIDEDGWLLRLGPNEIAASPCSLVLLTLGEAN